jgi:hypothetical protein
MNSWREGVERGPDGLAREIPVKHVWTSGLFITRKGVARRRWYNVATKSWHWDPDRLPLTQDEGFNVGYHAPQFVTVERAICMAWRLRAHESTASIGEWIRVQLVESFCDNDPGDEETTAETLRWQVEEDPEEDDPIEGETWSRLKAVIGAVVVPRGYWISSVGRLRNPKGDVTRGSLAFDRRWAAVKGCGMLDLWTAAGLADPIQLSLRVRQARGAILAGATAEQLAEAAGVEVGTAWSYMTQAAPNVDATALRERAEALVHPAIWRAVRTLVDRGDGRVGGSLLELRDVVERLVQPRSKALQDEHHMSMLRLSRTALTTP